MIAADKLAKEFLDVHETADALGVSKETLRFWRYTNKHATENSCVKACVSSYLLSYPRCRGIFQNYVLSFQFLTAAELRA